MLQSVILLQIMTTFHRSASQHLSDIDPVRVLLSVLLREERPCCKYHDSDWYRDCKVDP
jgi:hypothetical protein